MKNAVTIDVDLKAHVPQLMRAALKVAGKRCEYHKVKDCTAILEPRDWCAPCAPCALRRAAAKDLARIERTNGHKPERARARR